MVLKAELEKKNVEISALLVILRDALGNSGHQHKELHNTRVNRMQLDVLIKLTMVTPVMLAMIRLLAAYFWEWEVLAKHHL